MFSSVTAAKTFQRFPESRCRQSLPISITVIGISAKPASVTHFQVKWEMVSKTV